MLPKETNGKQGQPGGVWQGQSRRRALKYDLMSEDCVTRNPKRSCYNWILPTWKNEAGWLPPPRGGDKCLTSGVRMTDSMLSQGEMHTCSRWNTVNPDQPPSDRPAGALEKKWIVLAVTQRSC